MISISKITNRLALILVLVSTAAVVPAHATIVMVFIRDGVIYLAADSKVTGAGNPAPACKIVRGEKFAIALANTVRGRLAAQDLRTGAVTTGPSFDLLNVARDTVNQAESIDAAVDVFASEAQVFLDALATGFPEGKSMTDFMAVGFENGTPSILVAKFESARNKAGRPFAKKVITARCPKNCPRAGMPWAFGSQHVDRVLLMSATLPGDVQLDPQKFVQAVFDDQVAANKNAATASTVGPPYDILRIPSDNSSTWLVAKDLCKGVK